MRLLGFLLGMALVVALFAADPQKARLRALADTGLRQVSALIGEPPPRPDRPERADTAPVASPDPARAAPPAGLGAERAPDTQSADPRPTGAAPTPIPERARRAPTGPWAGETVAPSAAPSGKAPAGGTPGLREAPTRTTLTPPPGPGGAGPSTAAKAGDSAAVGPMASEALAAGRVHATPRLYPFWQPFTARGAALGFAERIQAVSGVAVELVETLGGYQAAVRYRDEAELRATLDRIERGTGLRLNHAVGDDAAQ